MSQDKLANRMVDSHQRTADGMGLFAVNLADQQRIDDTAQELRLKLVWIHMSKKETDRRIEGDSQNRSDGHRKVLREGQGFEQAAFLPCQCKNGHERNCDDQ